MVRSSNGLGNKIFILVIGVRFPVASQIAGCSSG